MSVVDAVSRRLTAALAAGALALGTAACGDSDDDSERSVAADAKGAVADATSTATAKRDATPTGRQGDAPDSRRAAPRAGGDGATSPYAGPVQRPADVGEADEKAATEAAARMYTSLANGDAQGVCDSVSKAVREQIASEVIVGSAKNVDCVESFQRFLVAAREGGVLEDRFRATIGKAEVDGDRATVAVRIGGGSGALRLVKEDGEWRVGTAPGVGGG